MLGQYILWSTLLVSMGNNDVGVHQVVTSPMADEATCLANIETLVKGRPGKQVDRQDGYVRTSVEIEGMLLINRLQCLPVGIAVPEPVSAPVKK